MVAEDWPGLSVLYVAPLRALANDIEMRLAELFVLLGRSVAAWHGDVGPSRRKAILREPPDLLITTPESLEVMLVSTKVEHRRLFADLRALVVDEIHSFGSDDRGWHLLSVLSRIERIRGVRLQRIGLSATVGNPDQLLDWVSMPGSWLPRPDSRVVRASAAQRREAEIRADYVSSVANAATVIAGLHQGEKRLVFCDSRADVERVATALRAQGIETYVSHSSLSRDERRRAEAAFAEARDCVIVATSTLELGIDVGDLDRVIQVDAPTSVASFLQRMGRTGRRVGTVPNTLFLTTKPEYLLRSAGLALLWGREFVEDVIPPVEPHHIVGQQLLGLCLQEGRVGSEDWFEWIEASGVIEPRAARAIGEYMRARSLVEADSGMWFIGEKAEDEFGRRNFMELTSVFTSPPLIEVRHGREQLGSVHESSFYVRGDRPPVLLLAGRSWALEAIDWKRRLAYVVPAPDTGDSKWIGAGQPVGFELCRAMREVLTGADPPMALSKRARAQLHALRAQFDWASTDATTLVTAGDRTRWWTFAGTLGNLELEWRLGDLALTSSGADELSVSVRPHASPDDVRQAVAMAPGSDLPVSRDALAGLKFAECLPLAEAEHVLRGRARDPNAVERCVEEPIHTMTTA
jgi:ATP-dependent Lhr-like helicase